MAEDADKSSPLHVVNPVRRSIIPEAELKSMLTPPALSLSHSLAFHLNSLPINSYGLHLLLISLF